jgi:hypothetical protein
VPISRLGVKNAALSNNRIKVESAASPACTTGGAVFLSFPFANF